MIESNGTYSTETVFIPTFKVLIGCPKCKSRNIRTFPDVQFMDDDFPEKATNFINIQGQCKDCGVFLVISPRQYMIDSTVCEPNDEETAAGTRLLEYGSFHFSGTLVDVGGELPKKKQKRKKAKKKAKAKPKRKAKSKSGPSDFDREMAESLGKAKPKKVKKKAKAKRKKMARPRPEKKRSDHPVCSRCANRDGEECLVDLAPSADEIASRCEGFSVEWYKCKFCEEEFSNDGARIRHQKTCDKKPDESQEREPLFLPSSTEVTQDPADVDKSILYTSGSDTLVSLVHEVQMFAYRKDRTTCPRTDYVDDGKGGVRNVTCGYEATEDEWLSPPMLKEISFGISDEDIGAPMFSEQEEMVVCISECPKCGRSSILHQFITTMLWKDFTDHRLIMQHIISRGLMEGKVKKKEKTEEQIDTRLDYEAQRLGIKEGFMEKVRVQQREAQDKPIPDFEIPCFGSKCKAIWTQDNSNPRWMSTEHLVARCSICGSQRPIQDELREMGIDV